MRFPLANIDDIIVLQYGEERMLVSMNLTTKEERYNELLTFVWEEWQLMEDEVVFETDEHPLCNGKKIKMNKCLFVPHITSLIGTIFVSVKHRKYEGAVVVPVEKKAGEEGMTITATNGEETTTNINAISRLLELTDLAIESDNDTEKGSSDDATIMIDRDEVESVASESSEESAPYDTLGDSMASLAPSEQPSEAEEFQTYDTLADSTASMMRSESDAEDIETTTTAPVSPTFSEEELPMPTRKPNDYKIFIRIHKNVTTTPAVVFKVKANQTVQSVFNRACTYFDFHPSLSAMYRRGSNLPMFSHMQDTMRSVCAQGHSDFIIYGCSVVGDRTML